MFKEEKTETFLCSWQILALGCLSQLRGVAQRLNASARSIIPLFLQAFSPLIAAAAAGTADPRRRKKTNVRSSRTSIWILRNILFTNGSKHQPSVS